MRKRRVPKDLCDYQPAKEAAALLRRWADRIEQATPDGDLLKISLRISMYQPEPK